MRKLIVALILTGLLALVTAVPVFAAPPEPLQNPICHADEHSDGEVGTAIINSQADLLTQCN